MTTANPTISLSNATKSSSKTNPTSQENLLKLCNSMIDIAHVVSNFVQGGKNISTSNQNNLNYSNQDSAMLNSDATFWNSIKNSMDPAEYKLYLKSFPNGMFKELAELRLERFGFVMNGQPKEQALPEEICFAPNQVRELLQAVKQGVKIIKLEEGNFELTEPLIFKHPVELIGLSVEKTTITFVNLEEGISFESAIDAEHNNEIKIRGIHFIRRGTHCGHVVKIERCSLNVSDCHFNGGVWAGLNRWEGCGLLLKDSNGIIKNSSFERNVHGLVIDGDSNVHLESCYIADNQLSGISYAGNSVGRIANTSSERNNFAGVAIYDTAKPDIFQSHLRCNQVGGIAYHNESAGTAYNNHVSQNGDGIILMDKARPSFKDNCINLNQKSGISYFDQSAGEVINNAIDKNGYDGITISNQAEPHCESNCISLNQRSGIVYLDQSKGVAIKNTVVENRSGQIVLINHGAKPELKDNYSEIQTF